MLSLAHLTVLPANPLELIEIGARAGFDAVGLRVVPPFPTDVIVPVVGDAALQRHIKQRLSETGVGMFDIEAFWLMPESDLQFMRRAIEIGAEFGARHVLIVGNDPDASRMRDNFAELCSYCGEFGLRPMLEFIPYSQIRSLEAAHAFLEVTDQDNAGLLVDSLHLSRSGGTAADLASYPSELFTYMHLCDARMPAPTGPDVRIEAREHRLYPGEGALELADFVRAFPQGTPVSIEAPNSRHAHLSLVEQARLAADAAKRLVEEAFANKTMKPDLS
jgi:sugar phosphate isomerase/epimerase